MSGQGGKMTLRERQIGAVANVIADWVIYHGRTMNDVKEYNDAGGWNVGVSNGRNDGSWLRCEDVVLTDAELAKAWAMAQEWIQ
jgi:hypothetical protein